MRLVQCPPNVPKTESGCEGYQVKPLFLARSSATKALWRSCCGDVYITQICNCNVYTKLSSTICFVIFEAEVIEPGCWHRTRMHQKQCTAHSGKKRPAASIWKNLVPCVFFSVLELAQ